MPEHLVGEIMNGELVTTPRLTAESQLAKSVLAAALARAQGAMSPANDRRGWWIFDQAKVRLGAHLLVPDLTGYRRNRMVRPPEQGRFESAPDWVCEVISAATAVIDRTRKLRIYADHGVCWLWLVEPQHRTVEVLWLEGDEWVVAGAFGGEDRVHMPPFDNIELDLSALWTPNAPLPVPPSTQPTP